MIKYIEMLEATLTALVDLLVESRVINLTEFEDKVKEKLESNWNWLDSNRVKSYAKSDQTIVINSVIQVSNFNEVLISFFSNPVGS